ncbi:stage II sporulation protein M [Candidatus Woesearchaeota archaeon]|nr:stage II sporulation protein M [Candidatus Woesearchaeota archaeon]
MVLEEFMKIDVVEHRPYVSFFLGFFFTFLGFFVALFFFRNAMSVAMVFLTTLFLVPLMIKLIKIEEDRERRDGLRHFFHNHADVFQVYLFSFLGIFVAFVVLGVATNAYDQPIYNDAFSFQSKFLRLEHGLTTERVKEFVADEPNPTLSQFAAIFVRNSVVLVLSFALAFFYGASAIFLIVLNASVFANFIVLVGAFITQTLGEKILALLLFMVHLLPELSAFLVAAIAGGVVSKALIKESRHSLEFRNVFKDSTMLIAIAAGLLLIGAFLETFVTTRLFAMFF